MSDVAAARLVGRDGEMRILREVMTHPPSVALVEGEPGIGKTRLVRAAAAQTCGPGRTLLLGHCHQLREPFPYGPVFEALRDLPQERLGELSPVTGALHAHLPELLPVLPPAPPPLADPGAERHRLFRAVRELLAAAGPAVLIIEDLHWADDGTQDLLRFLTGRPPEGLALVLTYRRPATGLPLGYANVVVSLQPLDARDVGLLAAALLHRSDLPPDFAGRLHERTSGIPFLVEEVVRALGPQQSLEQLPVPLLLREATAEQLARLSPAGLAVARAAAVLRLPVGEGPLAVVAGDLDGLVEALRLGVLHEHGDGRYGFRHPLAQEAAYATIPGPERRQAHERAVAALADADPPPLVQLTFHARRAGDLKAWLEYGTAAAQRAAAIGDTPLAVEVIESLLADPDLPASERAPLVLQLSRLAIAGLSHRRVIRLLRHLLSDEELSRDLRGEARLALGMMLSFQVGEVATGRPVLKAALRELEDQPALAARGWASLAMPGWGGEHVSVQEEWMALAERLAAAGGDPEQSTAVQANRAALAMAMGSPEVLELAPRLPVHDPSAAVRRQVARAYCNLYDLSATLGLFTLAKEYGSVGMPLAEEVGAPFPAFLAQGVALRIDWMTGRWEGLAARAAALVEETADLPFSGVEAHLVLGWLSMASGEWTEAESHLAAAGVNQPDSIYVPMVFAAWAGMIELHLARGNPKAAAREADLVVERLRRKGVWAWGDQLVPAAVSAYLAVERSHEAEVLVEELALGIEGKMAPSAAAGLHLARGLLASGDPPRAAECYARARAAYAAMPQPYAAARAGEAEAGALLALGDRTAAANVLAEAAERFAALGATRDAARCRHALREYGVAAPAPRRTGVLSQREREVARLVALGRTNKEIAEVLFLSRRTVETHVATLLRKLGVRSRTEIVVPAEDQSAGTTTGDH
ncbi:ATP-binding protein [Nonomuraea sp. NPDC050663]|uniref:ATP-binding protein n=1 Tax=Nonomuraea sp. NPDC050663 TaxID=3364370 RepID=UPI0037A5433E